VISCVWSVEMYKETEVLVKKGRLKEELCRDKQVGRRIWYSRFDPCKPQCHCTWKMTRDLSTMQARIDTSILCHAYQCYSLS